MLSAAGTTYSAENMPSPPIITVYVLPFSAGIFQVTFDKRSPKHLNRYVTKFAGKHNGRDLDTFAQMATLAAGLAGRGHSGHPRRGCPNRDVHHSPR